jgi:hypothetical protein
MLRKDAQEELGQLQREHGGLLRAQDVVSFAKNPATALHGYFTWDDSEAAELYRLSQARAVIRLSVTVISEEAAPVRAFVSLPSDRMSGGGYRSLTDVVNDEVRRGEMLADALARLGALRRKYAALQALLPVWEAVDKANDAAHPEPTRAAG